MNNEWIIYGHWTYNGWPCLLVLCLKCHNNGEYEMLGFVFYAEMDWYGQHLCIYKEGEEGTEGEN